MSTQTNNPYNSAVGMGPGIQVNAPPPIAALDQQSYNSNSSSGEALQASVGGVAQMSPSYTPPAQGTIPAAQLQAAVNNQNQPANTSGPLGMSPGQVGQVAGKAFNTLTGDTGKGTFSSQINAIDNFGSKYLGTAAGSVSSSGTGGLAVLDSAAQGGDVLGGTSAYTAATSGMPEAISPALAAADTSLAGSAAAAPVASGLQSALGISADSTLGSLTAAGSLSGVLGAAGLGALAGGYIAGWEGGNSTGGSIGGAIGAGLGDAVGGPIGGAIGAVLGSSIGGLFGNNTTPTSNSEFSSPVSSTGALNVSGVAGKGSTADTQSAATDVGNTFSNTLQAAHTALGINFDPKKTNIEAGYNSMYTKAGPSAPGFIAVNGVSNQYDFTPGNTASLQNAELQALTDAAKSSGYTDAKAISDWFSNYATHPYGQGTFTAPAQSNIPLNTGSQAQFQSKNLGQTNANSTAASNV